MDAKRKGPIGIELVKRGVLTQADINKALEYQRRNPGKKIIEIISTLNEVSPTMKGAITNDFFTLE